MGNFRRTAWATIIFIGLLAPFAIVLAMSLEMKPPVRTVLAAGQGGAGTQEAPSLQTLLIAPPPSVAGATSLDAPLLASGDGKTLWVVHPVLVGDRGHETHAYELLARSSNSGTWSQAQSDRGVYFSGFPRGVAAIGDGRSTSAAYVFTDHFITRFTLSEHALVDRPLAKDQMLLATAGGVGEMFAVTLGPKGVATTAPAEMDLPPPPGAFDIPTSEPAATHPAGTQAATAPAASQPVLPPVVNVWWYHDDEWTILPGLGEEGPGAKSAVTVVQSGAELIAVWADAGGTAIHAREIDYKKKGAAWGMVGSTQLDAKLPVELRLLSVQLDGLPYVFWPEFRSGSVFLKGGAMGKQAANGGSVALPAKHLWPALNLGRAVAGEGPLDVALGAAENSLAVVVQGEKGALSVATFTDQGAPLGKMTAVEVKATQRDLQVAQNVALLILVLLVFLSLWQWRQRRDAVDLPVGMVAAPLSTRGLAFGIDLFIALMVVSAVVGISDYATVVTAWTDAVTNPERLMASPSALYTLGLYLVHVTIGELFFGRSVGKALFGLQVVMSDGKAPTVGAILLRNLIRLPELLSGIVVINLVLSDNKQRLGDAMAKTVVVTQDSPDVPEEGEKEQKKDEEELVGSGKKDRLR